MISTQAYTERNVDIAKQIAESIHEYAVGVLLSGSNAWGAGYAVSKESDIDIAIIVKSGERTIPIVKRLVSLDFMSSLQMKRADTFVTSLHSSDVDIFSLSEIHNSYKLSVDIIPEKIFNQIVDFSPMREVTSKNANKTLVLRTVMEFRSNQPKNTGYTVDNLKSTESFIYHPKFYEVESDGYVAESLVDSLEDGYYMGVYSFFLAVEPKILSDTDLVLTHAIHRFQKGIAGRIGKSLVHITRQERMSKETFSRIQDTFSQ